MVMTEAVMVGGYALMGSMAFIVVLGAITAIGLNYLEKHAVRDKSH